MGRMKAYSAGGLPGPKYAFVAIGQPLPTMNINELPLECNMFVSRVNMDLRIVYCEGRYVREAMFCYVECHHCMYFHCDVSLRKPRE